MVVSIVLANGFPCLRPRGSSFHHNFVAVSSCTLVIVRFGPILRNRNDDSCLIISAGLYNWLESALLSRKSTMKLGEACGTGTVHRSWVLFFSLLFFDVKRLIKDMKLLSQGRSVT
jgi:hypothetical protein